MTINLIILFNAKPIEYLLIISITKLNVIIKNPLTFFILKSIFYKKDGTTFKIEMLEIYLKKKYFSFILLVLSQIL